MSIVITVAVGWAVLSGLVALTIGKAVRMADEKEGTGSGSA